MRQITEDAVRAFFNNESFKRSNTRVARSIVGTRMYLHGNLIAEKRADKVILNNRGWDTPTTKERLNGILDRLGVGRIYQKDFVWYWKDGEEFLLGTNMEVKI